tara:strand:- start:877 stop:1542 length:666 start_codon:yes stop_codon:yes gene_type:complete
MKQLLIAVLAITLCAQSSQAEEWTSLFNKKDLSGWIQKNGTAKYVVKGNTIVGTTNEGSPNSFLCSEKLYGNFELEFEVKCDNALNSGVQIRSKTKPVPKDSDVKFGRVFGPQVEIEASGDKGAEAGYIYGEATGRGWLTVKEELIPHKHFKDGQWNHYRVVANGSRIQTWINGQQIADLTDEPAFESHPVGFIGLQVHGIKKGTGPYTVAWRKIRIREIK